MDLNGTRLLVEMDWKNVKKDWRFLKYGRKVQADFLCLSRNVTHCNNFSKISLHFKKMANYLRKSWLTYSEICLFSVIQYVDFKKQSIGDAFKALRKTLKTVFDEVCFITNLHGFPLTLSLTEKPFLSPGKSHFPTPRQNKFKNFSLSLSKRINNSLNVNLFLDSEP